MMSGSKTQGLDFPNNAGFRFSELGLTRDAADIFAQPFRSQEDRLVFLAMREQGLIPALEEPVSLQEIREKH